MKLKLLEEFAEGLDPVSLSYLDFLKWLNAQSGELGELFGSKETVLSQDQTSRFQKISNLFVHFQAFLASFVRQNLETSRFHRVYLGFNDSFRIHLSKDNPDYGDISLVVDRKHADEIKSTINRLQDEFPKYEFDKPGMRTIDVGHILRDRADTTPAVASLSKVPFSDAQSLLYLEVVPDWTSKSGIGAGRNFVVKS